MIVFSFRSLTPSNKIQRIKLARNLTFFELAKIFKKNSYSSINSKATFNSFKFVFNEISIISDAKFCVCGLL